MRACRRFHLALGLLISLCSVSVLSFAEDTASIAPDRLKIREELMRDFDHMQMSLSGKMVECKGAVSLWQVAKVLGRAPGQGATGGKEAITSCVASARKEAETQYERIRGTLPDRRGVFDALDLYIGRMLSRTDPTSEVASALEAYLTTAQGILDDFAPHADLTQRESPSAYDARFSEMEDALEARATRVRETIRNWR